MRARGAIAALFAFALGSTASAGCDDAAAKPAPRVSGAPSIHDAHDTTLEDAGAWRSISGDALCTTSGATHASEGARFAVDAPTFRAIAPVAASRAELDFVYVGETAAARALGSGAMRHQLGFKIMARNPCNLVYAIWRIGEGGAGTFVVQTKRNLNQATSPECGNRGYTTVRPRSSSPLPNIAIRSRHVLRVEVEGSTLRAVADGAPIWEGTLPNDVLAPNAPIGIRSDNVRFDAELRAEGGTPMACAPNRGDRADDENAAE